MRTETDLIGPMAVADEALYGINTLRTVENMSFSGRKLADYPEYIRAMAQVKKAAAIANCQAGLLAELHCEVIGQVCDQLIAGDYQGQFVVDMFHGGGGIGSNMNINEVIANLVNERLGGMRGQYAPIHPTEQVNASQSTADVCHTAMRLAILDVSKSVEVQLERVINTFLRKAEAFRSIPTIARTCLQDGISISLGDSFSGYVAVLTRRLAGLRSSVSGLSSVNLGGTVVGSGTGASQTYREHVMPALCRVVGKELKLRPNLYDAAQNLDDLGEVAGQLALLAGCLIKIAKDLRLLSSGPEAGFAEISLPAVQAGSSFFPGKVNPVIPEMLIQCCFQVIGASRAVEAAIEHGELQLNIWEGMAGSNILDSLKMLAAALNLFHDKCLAGLVANEERCRELAASLIPAVVELKETYGYAQVSAWMKEMSHEEIKNKAKESLNSIE
ncbi:lyase family protein [Brevibacillus sp. B_LB10_24]|uniref:lyase family protein n=1 Tax=Brevibacillus sp. B_LB10_24 TaxID=3380645 RepID=UPI0038BC6636